MEKANVLAALNDARDALDALISNEKTIEAVVAAAGLMADAVEGDGKVMSCGKRRQSLRRHAILRRR